MLLADLQRLSGQALTFAVIPAVAAAVVGRFASLPATVAGGLAIGVCEALLTPVPIVGPFRYGGAISFRGRRDAVDAAQNHSLSTGELTVTDRSMEGASLIPATRIPLRAVHHLRRCAHCTVFAAGYVSDYWLRC